jgi:hypothetical protein
MRIDLAAAIGTLEDVLAELRDLDGAEADAAPTRAAKRQRVDINRRLLECSHLADRARVQVMDAYYTFKHQLDPIEGGEDG